MRKAGKREAKGFWEQVDKSGDCWLWTGVVVRKGYGRFRKQLISADHFAHRWAWYETYGEEPPKGMEVCHRCDQPSCVNPDHLFLGTHADNMRDMQAKGRARGNTTLRPSRAKLTIDDKEEMAKMFTEGASRRAIQRRFKIGNHMVKSLLGL